MSTFLLFWGLFMGPIVLLVLPIAWLGRKRARWYPWEAAGLLLPFSLWWALLHLGPGTKTMLNMFEPFLVALVVLLGALIRVARAHEARPLRLAMGVQVACALFAALVYFTIPVLLPH